MSKKKSAKWVHKDLLGLEYFCPLVSPKNQDLLFVFSYYMNYDKPYFFLLPLLDVKDSIICFVPFVFSFPLLPVY